MKQPGEVRFLIFASCLIFCLAACGGGGGGSTGSAPEPPPTNPDVAPTRLALLDSVPGPNVTNVEPQQITSSFAHPGHTDLGVELSGDCNGFTGTTIRRNLFDLSTSDFNQILDHRIKCNLDENTSYKITANGIRSNDAEFVAELQISTGVTNASGLTVINEFDLPRDTVNTMFLGYVNGALFDDLYLPSGIEVLIRCLVLFVA